MGHNKFIYLDNNATTELCPAARLSLQKSLNETVSVNLGSPNKFGAANRDRLSSARARFSSVLPDSWVDRFEIIFTSGATEANHLALMHLAKYYSDSCHLIYSGLEHSSLYLEKTDSDILEKGFNAIISKCSVDIDGNYLLDKVNNPPSYQKIACLTYGHNETGIIPELTMADDIRYHLDMSQSFLKIPLQDLAIENVASIAISGHKMHGPVGVGVLLLEKSIAGAFRSKSILPGGGQEFNVRHGTHHLANIEAFVTAVLFIAENQNEYQSKVKLWRNEIERIAKEFYPQAKVIGESCSRLPHTLNICFPGIHQDDLIELLADENVCLGKYSACDSGSGLGSRCHKEMGISPVFSQSALRIGLSILNQESEIEEFGHILQKILLSYKQVAA